MAEDEIKVGDRVRWDGIGTYDFGVVERIGRAGTVEVRCGATRQQFARKMRGGYVRGLRRLTAEESTFLSWTDRWRELRKVYLIAPSTIGVGPIRLDSADQIAELVAELGVAQRLLRELAADKVLAGEFMQERPT
jgi:hypothetical protein